MLQTPRDLVALDSGASLEPWVSDGTAAGTRLLVDLELVDVKLAVQLVTVDASPGLALSQGLRLNIGQ